MLLYGVCSSSSFSSCSTFSSSVLSTFSSSFPSSFPSSSLFVPFNLSFPLFSFLLFFLPLFLSPCLFLPLLFLLLFSFSCFPLFYNFFLFKSLPQTSPFFWNLICFSCFLASCSDFLVFACCSVALLFWKRFIFLKVKDYNKTVFFDSPLFSKMSKVSVFLVCRCCFFSSLLLWKHYFYCGFRDILYSKSW